MGVGGCAGCGVGGAEPGVDVSATHTATGAGDAAGVNDGLGAGAGDAAGVIDVVDAIVVVDIDVGWGQTST